MSKGKPWSLGFDSNRLERVSERIKQDIEAGRYDGTVLIAAWHGEIVLQNGWESFPTFWFRR